MVKKKKIFICSSLGILSIALGTLFLPNQNPMLLNADEVVNSTIIDGSNTVNGADSYGATATGTVKTATGYDVTLSVGDFRANAGQAGVFRNSNGYVANTTPIRGITKLGICANADVDVELGYYVNGTIYWEFSSTLTPYDFPNGISRIYTAPECDYPVNYFRFKSKGFTQVKKFEIYYSCGDVDVTFNESNRLNLNASYTDDQFSLLVKSKKENGDNLSITNQGADDNFTHTTSINVQSRTDYTYEMALPKRNYFKDFEGFRFATNYANVTLKLDGYTVLTTTDGSSSWYTIMISKNKKVFVNGRYVYTLTAEKGNGTERIDVTIVTNSSAPYAYARFTRLFAYSL